MKLRTLSALAWLITAELCFLKGTTFAPIKESAAMLPSHCRLSA